MSARRKHLTADHDPEIAANPNLSDTPADAFAVVAAPGAWGGKFDTGDMLTIMNKRGNSTDATVVDIDHAAFPAMFKIRFNDRRKEEVWKTATELTAAVSGSPAPTIPTPSTATDGDSSAGAGSTNPAPTGSPTRRQSGEIFCAGGIQSHTSICDGSSGAKVPTVAKASCSSSVSSTGGRSSGGQSNSNGSFSLSEDPFASRSAIDASLATASLSMQAAAEVLEQTASLTYGDSNGVKNNHPTSTPSALACVLSNQATDRHGPVPGRNDSQSSISMLPSTDEKHAGDGIIHAAGDMIVEPAGGGGIGDPSLASAAAPAVVPTTGSGGTARDDHFNIDDTVIVMDKHGRPSEAKIASVNHSISPALFKICFKDRRKKEAWKPATELITPARCMATPSAAAATVVTASENDRLFHSAPASKPSNQATCGEELATPGSNCRDATAVLHPTDQLPRRKRVYPTARHPINDTNVLTHDGGIGDPAMVAAKEVTTVVPSEATPTDSFNVADMVIVTDKYGHPANATVMSIDDATSPTLYKLRFKDRRKKEIWKPAVELIASIGGVPVPGVGGAASVANAGSTSSAVYTPSASGPSKTVSLASTGAALSVPPSVTHGNKDEEDGRPTSSFFASALTSNSQAARGEKPVPPRNIRRVAAPRSTDERNAEQRAPSVITVCPADITVKSAGGGGTGNPATTPTTVRTTSFAATTRRAYFNVADTVIAMDKYGHPVDAVVVGVDDTVSPPLFKVSFKGRRKKEAWKTATELTACAGNTRALAGPAASTAAAATAAPAAVARAPAAAAPAADASIGGNSSKPLMAATRDGMVRENESPAPGGRPRSRQQERIRHHGEKKADVPDISAPTKRSSGEEQQHAASGGPSRAGLQSEKSQKLKRSSDGDNWQKATTNNINNNNNQETYAPRGRDAVSQPLPRRRAAAAAAGAILSTSKSARRKRINPLQQQQSTKKSHNGLPPGAGEQGQRDGEASPARDAATTTAECGQIPRKLGLSGRKRPRVVTPGFAAAASLPVEPALRSELSSPRLYIKCSCSLLLRVSRCVDYELRFFYSQQEQVLGYTIKQRAGLDTSIAACSSRRVHPSCCGGQLMNRLIDT